MMRFQVLDQDPTLKKLKAICNYIQTIYKHGEINNERKKEMRPKAAQVGTAHGLAKIRK